MRSLQTIKPSDLDPACGGNQCLPSFIPSECLSSLPLRLPLEVLVLFDKEEE